MSQPLIGWARIRSTVLTWVRQPSLEMDKVGALFGLVILWLVFSIMSPTFRQPGNLRLIVTQAAPIAIVAVGQTLVLLTGGIDLSVSSIVALTGLVAASLMKYGIGSVPPFTGASCYVAIGVGLGVGTVIGAAQGWLIANRRMPSFIVTLGTMVAIRGLTLSFSAGSSINALPSEFKWISDGYIGPIPIQVVIMMVAFVLAWYVLRSTKLGRYCYAIGGNETAARLSGVKVDRTKMLVYAISGLLAALAGMILMSYIDASYYTNGEGYEMDSIAAAIIGGTSLSGGTGGVWGTLIGVMIIRIVPNGMVMLNAPSWWRDVVTGVVILLAVLIDVERTRARKAVPKIAAGYSTQTGLYLGQVVAQISQLVEKQLGCPNSRIYLVDRESNELVPQQLDSENLLDAKRQTAPRRDGIVKQAQETGTYIRATDIPHHGTQYVTIMRPEIHSALALPLTVQNRVIGVIEVQSAFPDAFEDDVVGVLEDLVGSMAQILEDAWLMESGWLARQVRDALRHLWDDQYLGRSALAEWLQINPGTDMEPTRAARGETVRHQLLTAIDEVRAPVGESHEPAKSGRGRRILKLTYVEERVVDEIIRELHISRRQYFYDLKNAVEALADTLVRHHQARQHTSLSSTAIGTSPVRPIVS